MADFSQGEAAFPPDRPEDERGLLERLLSPRVGRMLWRNTVVSCSVFMVGLGVLYALVQEGGFPEVPAAGIGFLVANSLHYVLGRAWIFRGTDRPPAAGYALFLVNASVGLAVTMLFYAALLEWTHLHYLTARVIVSVFAGLVVFVLNAVFNFRQV
ncbi:MAG: GtrA family protein [Altererythrobacter sp.]|nr:GtrA family protein [Altererythrobacter sp.]